MTYDDLDCGLDSPGCNDPPPDCVICKTKPVDPEDAREGFNVCPACAKKEHEYRAMLWDLVHEDPSGEMFGWAVR